ncbi:MAG TPA: nucleotide exchange factor GrpE [Gemmatimonadales bacterium]|nr:nucleotide exchange factor GrpE [Gemmatimonadales bacterium]
MAKPTGFGRNSDGNRRPIDTPAGMAVPESDTGDSADGEDIASTDMSSEPSSRTDETQPQFLGGQDTRLVDDLAELKDRHLRLAAEYDNYRKRSSRERAELADRAQASFVAKLLDVLDDLDRLVASDPSTPLTSLREGLSAVDRKLWKELQDAGVERIDPVGTPFDPALHEAVSTTPAPERSKEHVVSATFQPGYRFKGTMVRPARVQVYSEQAQR